jgi:nucleolar protein 14
MDEADLKVESSEQTPSLCLEAEAIGRKEMSASLLFAALHFVEVSAQNFTGSGTNAEKEIFAEITESILALEPKAKTDPLPRLLQEKVLSAVVALEAVSSLQEGRRFPLQRRAGPSKAEAALPTMAPRYEKPEHSSSVSRRCPMNPTQAEAERARREYRREHKAVARDLRTDNAIVESERRREQKQKNTAEKERRHKAFAWLEQEQAVMNQQVRQGGGLLQGGGTGAAKAKARSGKLGIKKGGKF